MRLPSPLFLPAILLCAVTASTTLRAAEIRLSTMDAPSCDRIRGESVCVGVSLRGRIEVGDAQKLEKFIAGLEDFVSKQVAPARVVLVSLNSPGGHMNEAMAIGRFIRRAQISTQVPVDGACASSCVLVLAGGVTRLPAGSVVIHSFYSPEVLGTNDFARAEKLYSQVADSVAVYLKEMRVSSLLLEEMMRIPHFTSRTLEVDETVKLGLLGIDPVYAQARRKEPKNSTGQEKRQ